MSTPDQKEKRFLVVDPSTGRPEAYIMGCDLRDAEIAVASLYPGRRAVPEVSVPSVSVHQIEVQPNEGPDFNIGLTDPD